MGYSWNNHKQVFTGEHPNRRCNRCGRGEVAAIEQCHLSDGCLSHFIRARRRKHRNNRRNKKPSLKGQWPNHKKYIFT